MKKIVKLQRFTKKRFGLINERENLKQPSTSITYNEEVIDIGNTMMIGDAADVFVNEGSFPAIQTKRESFIGANFSLCDFKDYEGLK